MVIKLYTFLIVILITPITAACVVSAEGATEIPGEALAGWEKSEYLREHVTFEGVQTLKFLNGKTTRSRLKVSVRWPYACMEQRYLDTNSDRESGETWVLCRGPKYSFFLEKKGKGKPFVVKAIVQERQDEPSSYFIYLDNFLYTICEAPYRATGKITEIAKKPHFSVQSVREEETAGRPFVVVDCSYEIVPGKVRTGFFRLDPSLDWAVVQYDFVERANGDPNQLTITHRGACEYRHRGGHPVPEKLVQTTNLHFPNRPKDGNDLTDWQLKEVDFRPIDDDAFSLASFGVPEILYGAKPRGGLFSQNLWLMWTCLGVAVVATPVIWMNARRSSDMRQKAEP